MLQAWAFLTRLHGGRHGGDLSRAVPWFPVVGLVIGGLGAAVFLGAGEIVPAASAAVLAVAVTAAATGALHEDGLADTVDALAGGWTREQRLEILKDSRHGTFGVLALVLITIAKVTALAPLQGWDAVAALVCAHVVGRATAVAMMALWPSVRAGLGQTYGRDLGPRPALVAAIFAVAVCIISFGSNAWAPLAAGVLATASVGLWAKHRIGGVTGDVLGAGEQVGEAAVLLAAAGLFS